MSVVGVKAEDIYSVARFAFAEAANAPRPTNSFRYVDTDATLFNTTALRITRPWRLFRFATPRAIQGSAPRLQVPWSRPR